MSGGNRQMRPLNAVPTLWDPEAIDTSHLGFRLIQKIATIHNLAENVSAAPQAVSLYHS
jgi:hypothetical protein